MAIPSAILYLVRVGSTGRRYATLCLPATLAYNCARSEGWLLSLELYSTYGLEVD